MTLLDRVKLLCKENGISQGKMEKEIGISNGASSKWRTSSPSMEILQKLSNYFNVSLEYLTTGEEKAENASALSTRNERDIEKALQETLDKLDSQDGLMFDGEALDDETKELLKISLEGAIRTAKITAKKKFTPKKYKE